MFSIGIHDVLSEGRGIPAVGAIRQARWSLARGSAVRCGITF